METQNTLTLSTAELCCRLISPGKSGSLADAHPHPSPADYSHIMNLKKRCCSSNFSLFLVEVNLRLSATVPHTEPLRQATFNLQLALFPFAVSWLNVRLRGREEQAEDEQSLWRFIT